jgi:hypothetical protein
MSRFSINRIFFQRWVSALVLGLTIASEAYGLFDHQGYGGWRQTHLSVPGELSQVAGPVLLGSLHVDPLPWLPVSLGGAVSWTSLSGSDQAVRQLRGYDFSLETEVYAPPFISTLAPYFKAGWTVASRYDLERHQGKLTGPMPGYYVGAGLKFYVMFKLAAMSEIQLNRRTFKTDAGPISESSTTILLGMQGGL